MEFLKEGTDGELTYLNKDELETIEQLYVIKRGYHIDKIKDEEEREEKFLEWLKENYP